MRRPGPLVALVVLLVAALASCGGGGERRPNVLLISIDSLRPDRLGAYAAGAGGDDEERARRVSPSFDRLAAQGVLFENAVSTTSWTLPSHMALMTGLTDPLHGVTDNHKRLNPDFATLAELLADAGYATGGFWSGPNLHPAFGFLQGFDVYENLSETETRVELFEHEDPGAFRWIHDQSHTTITSPALADRGAAWMRAVLEAGEQPFFAFVHWWDPHYDYLPPDEVREQLVRPYDGEFSGVHKVDAKRFASPKDRRHLLDLYDAEIRFTDQHVGRLLDALDELGVADNTLVVFVADHGEEFFEHGRWGHQRTLFDEVVLIPLAMRLPGRIPAGVRAHGQARIQDVLPTVLELCDLPLPPVEGVSLAPLWRDPQARGRPQLLHLDVRYRDVHLLGARTETHKAIVDMAEPGVALVYDLAADPAERAPERVDLETSDHPVVVALRAALLDTERLRAELPRPWETEELPDELIRELEALGYLGD